MIKYGKVCLVADIPSRARLWRNDALIWKFCRQHTLIGPKAQERWLEKIESDPTIKMFGVDSSISRGSLDDHLGVAGFTSINLVNRNAEFSLYIAPEYQGKGYGRDALIALLGHGFLNWGLERIFGEVFDFNNHAFQMFLKLGFVQEGRLRKTYFKEGRFADSFIVSMLKEEFDAHILKKMKYEIELEK